MSTVLPVERGKVAWREPAERYGDTAGEEMHALGDLPANKWAAMYLLDCLPAGGR